MRRVWFLSLLTLQQSAAAWGDVSELKELTLEQLAEIEVTSPAKTEQKIGDAPATVHAITAEQIKRRGYRNIIQLLEDIPEIEINARGTVESYNLSTFRGVSGIEKVVLIYQDGVRINAITGSPTATQFNFPLHHAKRVEVIIGPASALYGADAFAGVVNIITKDAEDLQGAVLTGSAGRFSTTHNSAIYGKKLGDFSLTLSASQYYSAEPRFPDFYPGDYAGWFDYAANGTVQNFGGPGTVAIREYSTPTKANTIGAKLRHGAFEAGYWRSFAAHSSALGSRPERSLYIEDARIEATLEAIYARHLHQSADGAWSLKTQVSKGSQVLEPTSKYVNFFTAFLDNDGFKFETDKAIALDEEFSYRFSQDLRLVAGLTYQDFSTLPKTADLTGPYDPKKGSGSQGLKYAGTTIDILFFPLWYQNTGAFAQLQSRLGESLELTTGIRYDHDSRFGGTVNPRIGAVFTPARAVKAKLLYGEAFRAPSPYISHGHFGSFELTAGVPTGGFFNVPNPDLKPEKLRSIETGIAFELSESFKLTTDVFYNRVTDLIAPETLPAGFTFEGVPVGGTRAANLGVLRSYGGTMRLDSLFRSGELNLRPSLAYTFIDGDIDNERLLNTAQHTVKAVLDLTQGRFSLSPQFQFRTRSFGPAIVPGEISAPPYAVVNLAARYENLFGSDRGGTALFLNIRNLLDRRYANSNVDPQTAFAATPQDPIRFELGLTHEF